MSQTSYQEDPNAYLEGQLVDVSFQNEIISGISDLATITFGRFVYRSGAGAADDRPPRVAVPSNTVHVTGPLGIGFAINELTLEAPGGYAVDKVLRIMRHGRIAMFPEDAVTSYGAPVFVRFAAGGGGTELGAVRTDADTATAVALPGASFRSLGGAGTPVVVEFNPQN